MVSSVRPRSAWRVDGLMDRLALMSLGPPGTGKTHLSRALANESGSRMIAVT
jgi:SpoVK/Ycf46/Vps4 family AAA+-type ATPase